MAYFPGLAICFLIFFTGSMREYLNDFYSESRNYNLLGFWSDVCRDKSVRDLLLTPPSEALSHKSKDTGSSRSRGVSAILDGTDRLSALKKKAETEMARLRDPEEGEDDDEDLFAAGSANGTQELSGQRILQVATIVRNLSFEDDNAQVLAQNLTNLR